MAITKQDCLNANFRDEFHHISSKDSRGNPVKIRVNGACKTWVTRPDEFSIPVKKGLYETGYITHSNAKDWNKA